MLSLFFLPAVILMKGFCIAGGIRSIFFIFWWGRFLRFIYHWWGRSYRLNHLLFLEIQATRCANVNTI